MPDRFSKEVRSRIMSRIHGKNTGLEMTVFRALKAYGLKFRRHYHPARGTPDIALPKKKIAIFLDGDFWHGWRYPTWRHKLKNAYWRRKIEGNRARDRRTFAYLRAHGWRVRRVWEHEIYPDTMGAVRQIVRFIKSRRK